MARKRTLKSAAADPPARKKDRPEKNLPPHTDPNRPTFRIGRAVVAAAVLAGFVGGWLARKYFRLL